MQGRRSCAVSDKGSSEGWLERFNNYCGPAKGREEWFSLGENHEKVLCFGLHQLLNRLAPPMAEDRLRRRAETDPIVVGAEQPSRMQASTYYYAAG